MKTLYALVGKTCSGKDTLARKMSVELGLIQAVTFTDRKKRKNEHEGIEHYFRKKSTIKQMIKNKKIYDNIFSPTKIGKYHYLTTYCEIDMSDIIVVDPKGVYDIIRDKNIKRDIEIIYLNTSMIERRMRNFNTRSDCRKFNRRCESEGRRFDNFEKYLLNASKSRHINGKNVNMTVLTPDDIDGYIEQIKGGINES